MPTSTQHNTQLYILGCKISNLSIDIYDKITLGQACPDDIRKLNMMRLFLDTLIRQNFTDTTCNSLTEAEVDQIWDFLSAYATELCASCT